MTDRIEIGVNDKCPVPQHAIDRLALSVQPLVFETENADYTYCTRGTVFLVGYKGKPYVLTARHALMPEHLFTDLCIPFGYFTSDHAVEGCLLCFQC